MKAMKKTKKSLGHTIGLPLILGISLILVLFPILWTLFTSFKKPLDAMAIPPVFIFKPTLEPYMRALFGGGYIGEIKFFHHALNSIIIAVSSTAISVASGSLAAYSLSRFRFKFSKALGFFIIPTRMLPPIATTIPLYILMNSLGLIDTRLSLILSYSALNVPFATWMLKGFFDEIDSEMDDAALIDGCSRIKILTHVIIPLTIPGLSAASVFSFLLSWNDFALAMVLTHRSASTLPTIINFFETEEGIAFAPICAASILAILPVIIFITFTHKGIMKGLTFGSIKG